jgi:hypothetical protein
MSADRRSIDASSATGTADGDADAVVVEELETGDRLLVGEAMMMLFSSGSKKVAPPTAGYGTTDGCQSLSCVLCIVVVVV